MELETRKTHDFIEIKVDEIETTIFKNTSEVNTTIINLIDVIDDIASYTDKNVIDFINEYYSE